MNHLLSFAVCTANILGIFNDPFEFQGDYGDLSNPTRESVFELVVSKKSADEINYGPTFSQIITPELVDALKLKQLELQDAGFPASDLDNILLFVQRYENLKIFHFLRNNPPELLSLDKILRDKAAREGTSFDLPILGSTKILEGQNSTELKMNLMDAVFNAETLGLAKPQQTVKQALDKLESSYAKRFFGDHASNSELEAFSTPAGQAFFFWMYHSLNLQLISIDVELIEEVNTVKKIFAETLGDPVIRARQLKEKLTASDSGVLFTQESDAVVGQVLTEDGAFYPAEGQNSQDGTLVFLRSDLWEPDYKVIQIDGYDGFKQGRMNVVLATLKDSGQKFLLASGHGHSTRAEDGRLQISLVMEKFHELNDGNLQLLIGIDANTKSEEDVHLFREHLSSLGLIATQAGPTTVKQRMVTAQHSKAGRFAVDEEDYLITLMPESGGAFELGDLTVGFKAEVSDPTQPLPNIENPSDHYPVGATIRYF